MNSWSECNKALQALADSDLTVEQHSLARQSLSWLEKLGPQDAAREMTQGPSAMKRRLGTGLGLALTMCAAGLLMTSGYGIPVIRYGQHWYELMPSSACVLIGWFGAMIFEKED
jgi:hypothetical protein